MKKVLSFVLVLSMILGSFGMAFAAPADVVGKDYEDAVNVLVELGVVAGYEDGSYRPENIVTRAEMATFIIKAMGLADYAVGKSAFTDMAGHWADPFVAYAASLGFVAGNTDGTFKPDATVSYDQAITMLVQALGYKAEYLTGGYPGAFVNQAKTLGMLDGVKSGAAGANRGDVAVLLFNTLGCDFVRYDKDGALDNTVLGNATDNMLKRLGASEYNNGVAFVVKGTEPSVINLKEYQGAYVTAYKNSDNKIFAIEEVKSVFLKGDMDADATTLKFVTTDDVEYKLNLTNGDVVTFFTNGDGVNATTDTAVNAKATSWSAVTIAAEIDGNYLTKVYSIANWANGYTVMWDEDLAEELEEDLTMDGKDFVYTSTDEIDMDEVALYGVASLADIKEDDIVTYYMNNASEVVRVEVANTVVEGKVTKTNSDGDFYINGKFYEAASLLQNSDTVELSAEGKFFLNYDGKIVYAEAVTVKAEDFAIIADRENGSTGLRGEAALIKVILEDGSAKTYDINEDAIDDGKLVSTDGTTTVNAIDAVESKLATGSVIKFHVNAAGEVDKIASVAALTGSDAADVAAKGTYKGYKIADDAVILGMEGLTSVSALSTDADDYEVIARASLLGQKDVVAQYLVEDGEIVFMLIKLEGVTGTHVFAVSTNVDTLSVAEGEDQLYEVTMMVNGDEKVYTSKENLNNFATIYAIDFDAEGYAKTVTLDADEFVKLSTTLTTGASFAVGELVAYTLNKDGEINDIVLKSTGSKFVSEAGIKLSAKNYLDGYKVAKDVVVFEEATGDDAPYVVADMKTIAVDEALNDTRYLLNSDNEVAVILTGDVESEDGIYGMVVGYSQVQNADEETVYKVTLAIDGKVQEPVLTVYGASDFADTTLLAHTSFCAFTFEGGELKAVEITEGATAATAGAVKKVQDGNVALTTSGAFEAVADDVVVYEVAKDGAVSVSSFAKVVKNTNVEMFQLDAADKDEDGYDVIIIRK